jgi:hypothetical protein
MGVFLMAQLILNVFFLKGGAVRVVAVVVFSREGGHDEPVDFSGCVPNIL